MEAGDLDCLACRKRSSGSTFDLGSRGGSRCLVLNWAGRSGFFREASTSASAVRHGTNIVGGRVGSDCVKCDARDRGSRDIGLGRVH